MKRSGKTRVLLLLPGAFGPAGGLEMYDRLIVKGFQQIAEERGGACETLVLLDKDEQLDDRYFSSSSPRPRTFAASRPRFVLTALERALRFRPDLVVIGHVHFGALALALRAVLPRADQWFLVYGIDVWRRLPGALRVAVRAAEKVLSISDYTRAELCKHNGVARGAVDLLPCALDPFWAADFQQNSAASRADPARPGLLTVARLSESERHKGIDQVIRALPAIARAIPGVRYVIVGDGSDRPRLEQAARDAGVADRVAFRGRISPAALAAAYAECSLFVMPSAKEGFGIVFLEAALFEKPSIGGNHGGTPEVVADGETGRLVRYGDVEGFAAVAIELLSAPDRLRAMGAAAHRRLDERFTFDTFLSTLRGQVHAALRG